MSVAVTRCAMRELNIWRGMGIVCALVRRKVEMCADKRPLRAYVKVYLRRCRLGR